MKKKKWGGGVCQIDEREIVDIRWNSTDLVFKNFSDIASIQSYKIGSVRILI